VKLDFPVGGK